MESFDGSNGVTVPRETSLTDSMMDSALDKDATTVQDLNNDCLLEMCEHLNVLDLMTVAHVCNRFKQNARVCFSHSKKKDLDLSRDVKKDGDSLNQILLKTSKVLRNFGQFFVAFKEKKITHIEEEEPVSESQQIFWRKIIELLVRYSGPALKDLEITHFNLTDDIALMMRPIVQHLHTLQFYNIKFEEMFLSMLPNWAAELRELRLEKIQGGKFDFLHGPLPNLVKITLGDVTNLYNDDINEMLKYNPQLKEFIFYNRNNKNKCAHNILPLLTEHVPEIESLHFMTVYYVIGYAWQFGRLRKLTSLSLMRGDPDYNLSAVCAMSAANISLKYLALGAVVLNIHSASAFLDALSKFEQLETLKIVSFESPFQQIVEICRRCSELSTLHVSPHKFEASKENILEIIKHGKKLRSLYVAKYDVVVRVDTDYYKDLLKVVENRREKTFLEIIFPEECCVIDVPNDLAAANRKLLSVVVKDDNYMFDWI